MAFISKNVDDFANQIADLETALSNRQLNALEAKIFYDHLTSVYENVKSYETQLKTSNENQSEVPSACFITIRDIYLNTINLKIKLTKVLSSTESTSASGIINIEETNATKQSETAKNLDLQLRKQSYLIRQMQSLETQNDICATKAEILYKHLSQLYDMFISNQIQIEANIDDDGDSLQNQQKISTKIQQIVIDCQTKLKKIIKPTESTGYKRSASIFADPTNSLLAQLANPASSLSSSLFGDFLSPSPSVLTPPIIPPVAPGQQQQQQSMRWDQQLQQQLLDQQRFIPNKVGTSKYSLAGLGQQQQNPNST
ncbi:uncharacterized protein LOC135844135 [Planococcus citri]|uniref:uncharacterized protein LOC135844135 n=1 Tax=Planococcus citri TaxID=170843 RepID=UPI0031F8E8B5